MSIYRITIGLLIVTFLFSFDSKGVFPLKRLVSSWRFENHELIDFETYCLLNATSLLEVVQEKKDALKFSGELELIENGNYKSYGIVLKEGENQYFQIKGSTQILVVKSLFVLRLNYSNSKK